MNGIEQQAKAYMSPLPTKGYLAFYQGRRVNLRKREHCRDYMYRGLCFKAQIFKCLEMIVWIHLFQLKPE